MSWTRKAAGGRPGPRHTRRARLWLILGIAVAVLSAAALLLMRPAAVPYTPGSEASAGDEITSRLSRSLPAGKPAITFTQVAEQSGIRFEHFQGKRSTQLPEDMGSGAAWGDYDGDGDPDLYLVNEAGPLTEEPGQEGGSPARSALYRNGGGGSFEDVTGSAGVGLSGWGMGAAWGDYDGDGDLDLAVTRYGTNVLFRNDGGGVFTDVSKPTRIGGPRGFWTGASWADYDRDGDLDLYVCGYVKYAFDAGTSRKESFQYGALIPYTLNPSSYPPEHNLLYRNDGGVFKEVASQAGVDNPTGRSLSASWCDFDGDGWLDLYVANDISDNAMYHNRGDGSFEDVSHQAWVADYRGAMGLGIGDWENDGDFDIFITHWIAQENALYENLKEKMPSTKAEPMHFIDQADMLGLGQIALDYIGWGNGFFDFDNDGRLDIMAVNGSTFQRDDDPSLLVPMKTLLFWNGGKDKGYFEVGAAAGAAVVEEIVGRGAAFADYDGDGDTDVAIVVNGGSARLLRNEGGGGNGWLRLVLRGSGASGAKGPGGTSRHRTTAFANGALVRVVTRSLSQIREIGGGSSYLSQEPPGETHFGLGDAARVDTLEISWPSGAKQTFHDLPARATVRIMEGGEPTVTAEAGAGVAPGPDPTKQEVVRFWGFFNDATMMRMKEEFAGAAKRYEEALAIDPKHEDSLYYLGWCRQETGLYREARESFVALVTVNPRSARGHLALGALMASPLAPGLADLGQAQAHFHRAHEINGEETGPMLRLGELFIVAGDMMQARHWLESASRTNQKSADAAFLSGYVRWEAGDLEGARAFYRKAVAALKTEAPVQGVLSEGDRRATAAKMAAPPLASPMGKTLFGSLVSRLLQGAGAAERASLGSSELSRIYSPVRNHSRALARQLAGRTG